MMENLLSRDAKTGEIDPPAGGALGSIGWGPCLEVPSA